MRQVEVFMRNYLMVEHLQYTNRNIKVSCRQNQREFQEKKDLKMKQTSKTVSRQSQRDLQTNS